MVSRRAVSAFILVQLIAFAVSAQQSAEFGRAKSGEIVMKPKGSSAFSGSLELSLSNDFFGSGSSPRYGVTAGGTLVQDRLWFFASASREDASQTRFAEREQLGARVNGQIAGGHDFSAFFDAARRPELATTSSSALADVAPSSFLSLRYTGLVSDSMLFHASFTRSSRQVQGFGNVPAEW